MKVIVKVLAGGAVIAALASAAPASAQYYPGYGYGSPYGGNVVGEVLNNVLGGGYGYAQNSQIAVNQCAAAVQARLSRNGYGYGGGYGYASGRVLGISRVEPRGDGGLRIRGVATSGYSGRPDLTFSCKTDYRGFIRDIDVDRASINYNYGYTPYGNYDYSQYGYRRY
ncbi:MAG TPA: hypothetical protein VNR86_01285 [Sphingomicrobium sp.]|nr:hypothetical protein [Sphingomicrobium sp.]